MQDSPEPAALTAVRRRAESDPTVVGLLLTGSAARTGMATEHSDVDVYVVVAEPSPAWRTVHSPAIDVAVLTLDAVRSIPDDPTDWWGRYSYADARILLDRTDGELPALVRRQTTLTDAEVRRVLITYLDGWLNFAYRSLKSHRDGRPFEATLDAVESLPWVLPVVFALHHRVRPYNKYLRWELARRPLDGGWIDGDTLVGLVERIVRDGDPGAQRALYALVEPQARRAGFGDVVDAWGAELSLFR
ncbi:hypothetical protein [Actinocatenispora rupis]|uniref:Nucleotidyltransferase domain-containing protein n=1 Tax=Actinocatenispora rupis TaxID=519421 RepID=A0A8J3J4F2_9ACTN|nr:hypothetical protein [Actinocatenispora rupis]GID09939.1 hypothetical protein Aru02nite_08280 [Actinocatenispora rupis]